jgi:hypothetical protein
MIRHSVIFKLKYPKNSPEELDFLNAAKKLANIPGVENFECLRQTSKKIATILDYLWNLQMRNYMSPFGQKTIKSVQMK